MDNRPIGVFDSGVGGLTSVKELFKVVPSEDIVYFGDTARVPYGSRSRKTIIQFAKEDLQFLLKKDVKAVLIACGTVSSTSIEALREMTDVPIVGIIEPASKAAVEKSKNKKIAVLATKATIGSHAYRDAIHELAPEAEVYEKACPLFVPLIENGYFNRDNFVTRYVAEDYMKEIKEMGVDAVILGCTHYPLIKDIIADVMPEAAIIEAGKEAARSIKDLIEEKGIASDSQEKGDCRYYVSDITDSFKDVCEMFLGQKIDREIRLHSME